MLFIPIKQRWLKDVLSQSWTGLNHNERQLKLHLDSTLISFNSFKGLQARKEKHSFKETFFKQMKKLWMCGLLCGTHKFVLLIALWWVLIVGTDRHTKEKVSVAWGGNSHVTACKVTSFSAARGYIYLFIHNTGVPAEIDTISIQDKAIKNNVFATISYF